MKLAVLLALLLSGCANTYQASGVPGPMTSDPLRPVYVDCSSAVSTVNEMETISAYPDKPNAYWDTVFATLNGNKTAKQRHSSARTVLWSVRTQCYAM